jgi:purine-binding chemotaxis protein CheW
MQDLHQSIILRLDTAEYALRVEAIVEVLRMVALRPLPDSAPWIVGMMNMRGKGVPVMDLRYRLGMTPRPFTVDMIIVVAQADGRTMGLIADEAVEFLSLPPESIRPIEGQQSGILTGVAHAGDRLIMLLDPRALVLSQAKIINTDLVAGVQNQ